MSLEPRADHGAPELTARMVRAAFPKGTLAIRIREALGPLFADEDFAAAFPRRRRRARRAGVPVVHVDPAWTSRTCADCGHAGKRNRVTQAMFTCRGCGVVAHADRNASRNIAARGMVAWDAGRQSRAPAPARHGQGLDAAASITASDALAANSALQDRVKLTRSGT
jgi:hypothetical protein